MHPVAGLLAMVLTPRDIFENTHLVTFYCRIVVTQLEIFDINMPCGEKFTNSDKVAS